MNKVKRYVVLFLSSLVLASCGNSSSNSSSIESSLSSNTTLISSSSSSTVLSSSTSSNISSSNSQVSSSSSSSTKLENWPTTEDKNSTGERMTISEIYDYAKTIKLKESNGSSYSTNKDNKGNRTFDFYENIKPKKVVFSGQYLDRSESKNPVFYSDGKVLQVYCIDNTKVKNLLDTDSAIGNTYDVTGYITVYKYKPSILITKTYEEELLECSFVKTKNADENNTPSLDDSLIINTTVEDLRKINPETSKAIDVYSNVYHFKGYLDIWEYSKEYFMAIDNLGDTCDPFKTTQFKSMRINDYDQKSYKNLENYYLTDTIVEFNFYVFQYFNANKKSIYEVEIINYSLSAIEISE